jgi:hypothetical protein
MPTNEILESGVCGSITENIRQNAAISHNAVSVPVHERRWRGRNFATKYITIPPIAINKGMETAMFGTIITLPPTG